MEGRGQRWRLTAAKKAKIREIKKRSSLLSLLSQSPMSLDKSTSSAVQNEASAFLYICQTYATRLGSRRNPWTRTSWCWMGKSTKRRGLGVSRGSSTVSIPFIWEFRSVIQRVKQARDGYDIDPEHIALTYILLLINH